MNKIEITENQAIEIWGDKWPMNGRTKLCSLFDTTRWGDVYEVVFEHEGKFWRTYFELGSGDSDYDSWDESSVLECTEVQPMQIVVTEWFDVE